MFDSLSDKLGGILGGLRGRGRLSEDDVNAAMREIRVALLEADVALPVVKDFIETIKERAIGQDVIQSVQPGQQVIKIVHDALVDMLGSESSALTFGAPPSAYLMVGLQGSGKTTSTAKIAKYLTDKQRKKVLMASLDTTRPAAQEQLQTLGEQTGVATLEIIKGETPIQITERALKEARLGGFDVVMLDTAGRLSIDEALMKEVSAVRSRAQPVETLLVADAMTGQDAVNTAKAFDEALGVTGIILTRLDGDARGGAALSMRAITGKPIKLAGVGEKWDAIEAFHPERVAGRILGMGDVVSLVEKAVETVNAEDAAKMAEKLKAGQFDFNDLLTQMRQMANMGGMGAMMKLLPGIGKMASQLEAMGGDNLVKKQEAMILSMTPRERRNPKLMNASRKKRIAAGSGTSVQDVNKLCKQQADMQTMMKRMKKMGGGKMMGMMQQMMGGKSDELALMAQSMDPDALGKDMDVLEHGPLGPNPFSGGGFGGALPGLGGTVPHTGFPSRGGSKKNRKKKR